MPCAQRSVSSSRVPMGRKHRPYQKIPTSTESFGYALRLARVQKKWSIVEVAVKAGLTPDRLVRIENRTVQAKDSELLSLRNLFQVELAQWIQKTNS